MKYDKPSNPLDNPKETRWILRGLGVAPGVGNIIAIKTHNIIMTENPGPTDPLCTEEITTDYYHSNHRGDIVFTTDEFGAEKATLRYDAFGKTVYELNAENVKYKFSSKEWDSVAQLYYYGFRWYDPAHGIWITKDPIGISAGDLNVYRMVFNNPVGFVDIYGLDDHGWPFNGRVINSSLNTIRAIDIDNRTVVNVQPKSATPNFGVDIDFVEVNGTWYKIGAWNFDIGTCGESDDGFDKANESEQRTINSIISNPSLSPSKPKINIQIPSSVNKHNFAIGLGGGI